MVKLQLSKANQREYFVNKQGRFLSFTLLISNLEKAPLLFCQQDKRGAFYFNCLQSLKLFCSNITAPNFGLVYLLAVSVSPRRPSAVRRHLWHFEHYKPSATEFHNS